PLNYSDYWYSKRRARTVHPEIDPRILTARDRELPRQHRRFEGERVYFVTGQPVVKKKRQKELNDHRELRKEQAASAAVFHPARDLMEFLNEQAPNSLSRIINRNWPALVESYEAMPDGPAKESTYRVLHGLAENVAMIYKPVKRSRRLFTDGVNLH